MLWCAPEHIHDDDMDNRGSQKGDVYSYGIILQEIAIRKPPYSMYTLQPQGKSRNWSDDFAYQQTLIMARTRLAHSRFPLLFALVTCTRN